MLKRTGWLETARQFGRAMLTAIGFVYDTYRFARYGGWNAKKERVRRFMLAKASHSLEKSMAFPNRRKGAGWDAAYTTAGLLTRPGPLRQPGFAGLNAYDTLIKFLDLEDNRHETRAERLRELWVEYEVPEEAEGGTRWASRAELTRGMLQCPEDFFLSRYTVRHFSEERVDDSTIQRAIRLAMKAPTACNRQPWFVYHLKDPELIGKALKLQTGNRGFGDRIRTLLIICVDISAFVSGNERYQHWIDGGMFAMALVYALHSLGVASCCLNWSKMVKDDLLLRKTIGIRDEHTIIMMLGVGYPLESNLLCRSTRRPLEEVYSVLG